MIELIVSNIYAISGRGIVAFFEQELSPIGRHYRVIVSKPDGSGSLEAMAIVQYVRKVPPGEITVLQFPELAVDYISIGSRILILDDDE